MIERKELDAESLALLKELEAAAYADNPDLIALSYCEDWNAVAAYMDCAIDDIRLFANSDSYLLIAERANCIEIIDLALRTPRINIKQIVDIVTGFQKPFLAYCRQTTSYPILLYMEQKEKIVCFADTAETYENETFHWVAAATTEVYERMTVSEVEELTDGLRYEEEEYTS